MDLQQVEITINKDGQVTIAVSGVQGLECLKITEELEAALGGEILNRIMTPESGETPDLENPASVSTGA